jgi:hypothetical protein
MTNDEYRQLIESIRYNTDLETENGTAKQEN